jgi:putative transposase
MKKSRFSEEQIAYALRLAESGTPVVDVCRQIGLSEATYYTWKKKYADLGVTEVRRLKNARGRELVKEAFVCDSALPAAPATLAASQVRAIRRSLRLAEERWGYLLVPRSTLCLWRSAQSSSAGSLWLPWTRCPRER